MREALADYFYPDTFGQPEDQLKGPIQSFMRAVGNAYDASVRLHSEHQIAELGVRPDLRVEVNRALAGYIELKAPGRLVTPHAFKGREAGQWKKLQNLPNLIYTDSRTWLLYRTGAQRGTAVRIGDLAAGRDTR